MWPIFFTLTAKYLSNSFLGVDEPEEGTGDDVSKWLISLRLWESKGDGIALLVPSFKAGEDHDRGIMGRRLTTLTEP